VPVDALLGLRVAWATVPLTVGPAVEGAVDGLDTPIAVTLAVGCWAAWAGVLLALLVPRAVSLTVLRLAVPALVAVVAWAALRDGPGGTDLVAAVVAAVVVVLGAWPTVGARLVDGSSYGPERRMPLRVPPAVALAAGPLTVVLVLGGLATGPLLLAAGQWVGGVIAVLVGAPLVWFGVRSLHQLARRFLVLVPGGVVVADPLTLTDPVLLPRAGLRSVGPAPVDTDAEDLTLGAGGLVVELRLQEPSTLVRRTPGAAAEESVEAAAVLVSPTRPGAFLTAARDHGLPVA